MHSISTNHLGIAHADLLSNERSAPAEKSRTSHLNIANRRKRGLKALQSNIRRCICAEKIAGTARLCRKGSVQMSGWGRINVAMG